MRWWMRKENIFDLESIYNIGEYMTFHCHIHIFFRGYIKLISRNQITSENRQADLDLHAFSWHLLSFGMWRKNRHKKRRLKSLILVEFGLASPIQLIWCRTSIQPQAGWAQSVVRTKHWAYSFKECCLYTQTFDHYTLNPIATPLSAMEFGLGPEEI